MSFPGSAGMVFWGLPCKACLLLLQGCRESQVGQVGPKFAEDLPKIFANKKGVYYCILMGSMLPYIAAPWILWDPSFADCGICCFHLFPGSCDILICHVCALDADSDTRNRSKQSSQPTSALS